jgi:multicomponent K+:H+ antiporter subunit D
MISPHAVIWPIVLPLLAGCVLLLLERLESRWTNVVGVASMLGLLLVTVHLLRQADTGVIEVYLVSNWRAPFGIALALDRLSALMLVLAALIGLAAQLYALGGDARRSPHFGSLLQFQLMGVNGAFLTADLFNLFVFFEVLLIASYALALHGGGSARLRSAVHTVVFNLTASALFLIAVATLYGVTGTLNMADLALKVPQLTAGQQVIAASAGLVLLVVFGVKAAVLPLYFWLPGTYTSATASVAAFFAIMTKVGVYAVARVFLLVFAPAPGDVALWQQALTPLALLTIVLGALGALAAAQLRTLIAYAVVASAGALLLGFSLGQENTVAASLFYLPGTTLAAALMYLLADQIAAARGPAGDALVGHAVCADKLKVTGVVFFGAAVAMAGLPPLAGFLGKALLLQAAWSTPWSGWVWAVVLGSSLVLMLALAQAGSAVFWKNTNEAGAVQTIIPSKPMSTAQTAPRLSIALLIAGVLACALFAGPLQRYSQRTAQQLLQRDGYIQAVLSKPSAPPVWDVRRQMRERIEQGGSK